MAAETANPAIPGGTSAGYARFSAMPSSVIRRFDYDEDHRRLRVTFTSGDVYDYDAVPPEVVADFRAAFSKGQFFGPNIRDRYPYRRVARGVH